MARPVDVSSLQERTREDRAALSVRNEDLRLAVACCDLTTLEADDDPARVRGLAEKAKRPSTNASVPHVAALCTWWHLAQVSLESLAGSPVRVASVAGDFPSGRRALADKISEIEAAAGAGSHEIDVVMDRDMFLGGREQEVYEEIAAFRAAAGGAVLKVILETGELDTPDSVRRAALIAMAGGADFIKTSTGKMTPGATPEATLVMADAIADWRAATTSEVGLKVSGGVRTSDDAVSYVTLVRASLGEGWVRPDLFRIGASSLVHVVVEELENLDEERRDT